MHSIISLLLCLFLLSSGYSAAQAENLQISDADSYILEPIANSTDNNGNMNSTRNGDAFGSSFPFALSHTGAFLDKMWQEYGSKLQNEKRWERDIRDAITAAKLGHWRECVSCCSLTLVENPNAHDATILRSVASRKLGGLRVKSPNSIKFWNKN